MRRKRAERLLQATALRGWPVCRSAFRIGNVTGLEYDHARGRVTRVKLKAVGASRAVSVPWRVVSFRRAECRELLLSDWPHVEALSVQGRPVETLTVRGESDESTTLFVHDVLFRTGEGNIVSYEVGLLPKGASSLPALSVPAERFRVRGEQLYLPDALLPDLKRAAAAQLGWFPPA